MSVGVIEYCTTEGGSGYITDAAAPWISSFDITQESPVYDQDMGWLRDSQPGSFTYYQRFGAPYSFDGGTLPPYEGSGSGDYAPILSGNACGMSGLGHSSQGVLTRAQLIAPMPSITSTARSGCSSSMQTTEDDIASWVDANPFLALGIAAAAGALLCSMFGGAKR